MSRHPKHVHCMIFREAGLPDPDSVYVHVPLKTLSFIENVVMKSIIVCPSLSSLRADIRKVIERSGMKKKKAVVISARVHP